MSQYEVDILAMANADHVKYCRVPLVSDTALNRYARIWSGIMADRGMLFHSEMDFRGNFRAENIASGHNDPELVMRGWRSSIDHHMNIVNCSYKRTGIGYVNGYWTQVFSDGV